MFLVPGTRLGAYEILAAIGAGGMGEVYRARDTKLGREVAIKILPQAFTTDAGRLGRFEREARVLAALNHPNIGAIYGLEESDGTRALVLELVDGDTLADRLRRGRIAVTEALTIARQIADALDTAHDKGIIHRDLKPANIKITPDGTVKVLDFGLAKLNTGDGSAHGLAQSPTVTVGGTREGMLLGTAAYMSPEQARGQAVDKRTDIWAFGCVLYEMLTGRATFAGDTVSDTIAAILDREPKWEELPGTTPPSVRQLLRRCLDKDPRDRLRDIGDARVELREAMTQPLPQTVSASAPLSPHGSRWRRAALWIGCIAGGGLVAGLSTWSVMRRAAEPPATFAVLAPPGVVPNYPVVSPDGRTIAFAGTVEGGGTLETRIYIRSMNQVAAVPLLGTHEMYPNAFSPDGQWLLGTSFEAPHEVKKVALSGGQVVSIANVGAPRTPIYDRALSADWGPDGTIVSGSTTGLQLIRASREEPTQLTTLSHGEVGHFDPQFLGNGRAILFYIYTGDRDTSQVAVYDVNTGAQHTLLAGTSPRVTSSGHLLFCRGDSLWAVPFDPNRLAIRGAPAPLVDRVRTSGVGHANYGVGADVLVYVPPEGAGDLRTLVWVNRGGQEEPLLLDPRPYGPLKLSPDGQQLAVAVTDAGNQDIWIYDLMRRIPRRLTFGSGPNGWPLWTPDAKQIVFASYREQFVFNLFRQAADGTGHVERLTTSQFTQAPYTFTPDGKKLIFATGGAERNVHLATVATDGDHRTEIVLKTPFNDSHPNVSPDGRWLAYTSDESGQRVVYVRPFPNVNDGRWQISQGLGVSPLWGPDSRELFYQTRTSPTAPVTMMGVVNDTEPTFRPGNPVALFKGPYRFGIGAEFHTFDMSPDGKRFLMIKEDTTAFRQRQIVVVQHWQEELKRRVPTK